MPLLTALFLVLLTLAGCSPSAPPPTSPADSPSPDAAGSTSPSGTVPESPSGTAPAASGAAPSGEAAPAPSKTGPVGAMCGGIAGFGCEAGAYCSYPLEAQCGAADQSGTCKAIPQMCTKEFMPVCGCDDKTYSNACVAASAGVSVMRKGACS